MFLPRSTSAASTQQQSGGITSGTGASTASQTPQPTKASRLSPTEIRRHLGERTLIPFSLKVAPICNADEIQAAFAKMARIVQNHESSTWLYGWYLSQILEVNPDRWIASVAARGAPDDYDDQTGAEIHLLLATEAETIAWATSGKFPAKIPGYSGLNDSGQVEFPEALWQDPANSKQVEKAFGVTRSRRSLEVVKLRCKDARTRGVVSFSGVEMLVLEYGKMRWGPLKAEPEYDSRRHRNLERYPYEMMPFDASTTAFRTSSIVPH